MALLGIIKQLRYCIYVEYRVLKKVLNNLLVDSKSEVCFAEKTHKILPIQENFH